MAKKILVIDDDPVTIEMLKNGLTKHGYQTVVAYDGEEGLKRAVSESPQLIILDINMPKMDGYTFLQELKKKVNIKELPVIILTNKENMEDIFKVEGIREYIIKPINTEDMCAKIHKHLSSDPSSASGT